MPQADLVGPKAEQESQGYSVEQPLVPDVHGSVLLIQEVLSKLLPFPSLE